MLSYDQIEQKLAEFRRPKTVVGRLAELVRSLPEFGEHVRKLLEPVDPKEKFSLNYDPGKEHRQALRTGELFESLGHTGRDLVFRGLFGPLAPAAAMAWDRMPERSYITGYERRPFRVPSAPLVQRYLRGRWLNNTSRALSQYEPTGPWLAVWAPRLTVYAPDDPLSWLLACAIDCGGEQGEQTFQTLLACARGEHEHGEMGRYLVRALLASRRREGWEFIQGMLLAAQRQEGLRQTILENIDEAHPDAFRSMLAVIRDHDLLRFSATARAFNVWFGFLWDSVSQPTFRHILDRTIAFLDDPAMRRAAVAPDATTPPADQFLALWAEATEDAASSIALANPLLAHAEPERRYVALHMFAQSRIDGAAPAAAKVLLDDPDLRVAAKAFDTLLGPIGVDLAKVDVIDPLERLLARATPKPVTLEPVVWPWAVHKLDRSSIADTMVRACADNPARMLPHIRAMSPFGRAGAVRRMTGQRSWHDHSAPQGGVKLPHDFRPLVLESLGDASADVRAAAFGALASSQPQPDEVERLVVLLDRRAGDLRKSCIERILKLPNTDARAVGLRLAGDKSAARREAGLEVLRTLVAAGRASASDLAEPAAPPPTDAPGQDAPERDADRTAPKGRSRRAKSAAPTAATPASGPGSALAATFAVTPPTLDDALGLLAHDTRPAPPTPVDRQVHTITTATKAFWRAFGEEFARHVDLDLTDGEYASSRHVRFGPDREPLPGIDPSRSPEDDAARIPLADHWKHWLADLPKAAVDRDGLTLARAYIEFYPGTHDLSPKIEVFSGNNAWALKDAARRLLGWFIRMTRPAGMYDLVLDRMESILARHGAKARGTGLAANRRSEIALEPRHWLHELRALAPDTWTPAHAVRLYNLMRWGFTASNRLAEWRLSPREFVDAHAAGAATDADLIELLIGACRNPSNWSYDPAYGSLRELTSIHPPTVFKDHPHLINIVHRVRQRILEVELARGELDTAASIPAMHLACSGGLDTLERALAAVGAGGLARQQWHSYRGSPSRAQVITHIIARSFPGPGDSREAFAAAMARTKAKPRRLVELGVLAPQWAGHIEAALGWPGLEEACWWIHAHTKQPEYTRDKELLDSWAAKIAERTPVTAEDLAEGAVDVDWFTRTHRAIGAERWAEVDRAAKFASHGSAHARAQLFAAAMLGQATRHDLATRIGKTRHPDSVRALGLVPLPKLGADRDAEILARYELLQEFLRQSRKFGSMRQATEKRAVEIAMANLARSAGFPDPVRLQWAMETRAIGDLAKGPVVLEVDDARAVLSITPDGLADLSITKKGKPVKSIPAPLKKHDAFLAMKAQATSLKKQVSRMRLALEEAMCRGDEFTAAELRSLFSHPSLRSMLERLVFVGDGILGYAAADGRALRDRAGAIEPIKPAERLRLAHPIDLLARGDWSDWQAECFASERVQPFKQVFRELYPRTAQEADDATSTRRYAGHQVQPHQTAALLKTRNWVIHPEHGIRKTFHAHGLSAHLEMQGHYYTPAEVEGWTIETVTFTRRGQFEPIPLGSIPPILLSEVLRDIDLVVAVAHRGGVDPEASASTIEMRASLLRETCRLLRLTNVRVEPPRVLIDGTRASYTIHLGSAGASINPGRSLVIVAVHAAHRGRLFLPFADPDPKTAEVISKALLLARDHEIADPGILSQIRP